MRRATTLCRASARSPFSIDLITFGSKWRRRKERGGGEKGEEEEEEEEREEKGTEEKEKSGRAWHEQPGEREELRICTCPPSWSHYSAGPRMAYLAAGRFRRNDSERRATAVEGRAGRKEEKVRAGRRKRPRQDVGSCLPAGG